MRLLRVFPGRTKATPTDDLAFVGEPTLFAEGDAVHISVTFTWDLLEAERLAKAWSPVAPVTIGGPATGARGEDFRPGRYLKPGYVITSRGCPNHCWFCSVPKREGPVRELPITDGWNILDDNLLACYDSHIHRVFDMLARQRERVQFTGGLEAKRLLSWHVDRLRRLKPKQLFFAYDTPDDLPWLQRAGQMLLSAGFTTTSHALRCYVLCGYPKDDFAAAHKRMRETMAAGFVPMAMLYRDAKGFRDASWMKFQKLWARPAIICRTTPTPAPAPAASPAAAPSTQAPDTAA